jgi:DNA ligase (NAD+)
MAKSTPKERAAELRKLLHHHNYLYYVEARPEISDREFDKLLKELEEIESAHPELRTPDSPTQRVGGEALSAFETVEHKVPMQSIDKAFSPKEMREFDARVRKGLNKGEAVRYVVELKIDGVAISLTYTNGVLTLGATRGDGERGDDVTANLRTVRGVPLRLEGDKPPATFEGRGEVYMSRADFATLNEEVKARGEEAYANPRNLTAGSLKQLDPKLVAARKLRLFAYSVGALEGIEIRTHTQALETLKKFGFPVNPHIAHFDSIEEVITYCESWDEKRHDLGYETDGMVVKVDDFDQRRRLGATSKHPRWAIAFKYNDEQGITRLNGIELSVGKDGTLTPVALLEPIVLEETTVARASLHNASELARKDIRIGDNVVVIKAGKIIPYVVKSLPESRTGTEKPFEWPDKCPVCGSPAIREPEDVSYVCTGGATCSAQVEGKIESFGKRERMDISGLGEKLASQLVSSGLVKTVVDLYRLKLEDLVKLERMGKKSAQKLLDGIEASKQRGLTRLLSGLSIYGVAESMAELITAEYPTIDDLLAATEEQLAGIKGFGPVRAKSVHGFFHSENGQKLVADLRALGIKLTEDRKAAPAGVGTPLAGLTIVVTGTLRNYDRQGIEAKIKLLGGKPTSSVSKKTDFILAGEKPGPDKIATAANLGIRVLTEDEFEKVVAGEMTL